MKCRVLAVFLLTPLLSVLGCQRGDDPQLGGDPQLGKDPSGIAGSENAGNSGVGRGVGQETPPVVEDPVTTIEKRGGRIMPEAGRPKTVTLADTQVTDAELALLAKLPALEGVNLFRTETTDAGLAHLAGLTNLKWLSLAETPISDAGLAHLSNLDGLESLDLEGTAVTDKGLEHLTGLKSLTWLNVAATKVTEIGVEDLQKELPRLKVER